MASKIEQQARNALISSLKTLGYTVDKDNLIKLGSNWVGSTDNSGRTLKVIHEADRSGELEHFAQTYEYQKVTKREPALI